MRIFFLFISLSLLFTACNQTEKSGETPTPEKQHEVIDVKPFNPAENMKEGMNEAFHANGNLKMKGEVVDGKRHGVWTTWYENGVKWSENTYSYGVLEGKTVTYHSNGQVHYIGYYSSDKKASTWMFYDENGELIKEEDYTKK
jgi:antitoxin component YwqK of YwqJK toxin-antitoxin module